MQMVDKYGRAVAIGVRRDAPLTARARPGKPLPLELLTHPQRAVKRRLKGRPNTPEGYGNDYDPSAPILGMIVALGMDKAVSLLKTTGRYRIEVDGVDIGGTDVLAYACAIRNRMGSKANVIVNG